MKINSPYDVTVIGNAGIDTNIYFHGTEIDLNIESNFTENIDAIGQAGGYTCRGFARLGKSTAFIGFLGDDYHGTLIRETFVKEKIDIQAVFTDPEGTARSVNFMYTDGRRRNFYDGKGHLYLKPDLDMCKQVLSKSKLAHFNIPNWARYLLPIAKDLGLKISSDIQDVINPFDPYRLDFIRQSDILFFSSVNQPDPAVYISDFLALNSNLVIVAGMGAQGCALGTKEGIQYFPAFQMEQPVIDANGAGDSLAVGFISSYILDGYTLEDSVIRGQIAARFACSIKASSANLITKNELDSLFITAKPDNRHP